MLEKSLNLISFVQLSRCCQSTSPGAREHNRCSVGVCSQHWQETSHLSQAGWLQSGDWSGRVAGLTSHPSQTIHPLRPATLSDQAPSQTRHLFQTIHPLRPTALSDQPPLRPATLYPSQTSHPCPPLSTPVKPATIPELRLGLVLFVSKHQHPDITLDLSRMFCAAW